MPVVIPAGFAIASFGGFITGDSEQMFFTLGIEGGSGFPDATAADLLDAWVTTMEDVYSEDWSFFSVSLRYGPSGSGPVGYAEVIGAGGNIAGQVLPPNCAALVRKTSGQAGKENRGRMYMAGVLNNDHVDNAGNLNSGHALTIQVAIEAFFQAIINVTNVVDVVILHSTASSPTHVTQMTLQSKLATQRRRLRP